jgi:hypothetical protein
MRKGIREVRYHCANAACMIDGVDRLKGREKANKLIVAELEIRHTLYELHVLICPDTRTYSKSWGALSEMS